MDEVNDDVELGSFSRIFTKPEDPGIVEFETNKKASYFHQQLKATGILIYGVEDANFLRWAWNSPSPIEIPQLDRWVEENSHSAKPENRFLAALAWISDRLVRSFRRALDIRVSDEIGDEWAINAKLTRLSRLPPQRKGGWQPDTADRKQDQKKWVNPVAESVSIELPENISRALGNMAAKGRGAQRLGDLWDAAWGEKPETVFRDILSRAIPRVMPGMLGNVRPLLYFNASNDAVFARLAGSHPNSSLPGACAYASWNAVQANDILNRENIALPLKANGDRNGKSIVQGSRLDPIEQLIAGSIRQAAKKLGMLR